MGHAYSGFAFSEERVMRPRGRILSLVMRLGQRFESARRLSRIGLDKPNTRNKRDSQFIIGCLLTPFINSSGG